MKHVSFADKTVFVTDEAADSLVEYAALLGAVHSADSIRLSDDLFFVGGTDEEQYTA